MEHEKMDHDNQPLFVRVEEMARMLGISRSKAYAMVASGQIRSIKVGAQIRIPVDALREMVAAAMQGGQTDEP